MNLGQPGSPKAPLAAQAAAGTRANQDNDGGRDLDRADGALLEARFRDPPLAAEVAELRRQIARVLVGVSSLPAELPAYGMTLAELEVGKEDFALVLGRPDPMARIRIRAAQARGEGVVALRTGRAPFVALAIEALHPSARLIEPQLRQLSLRLRAAINEESWAAARALVKQLKKLPVDVPIAHFRQMEPGQAIPSGMVRVGFLCNQDCGICWQDRDWSRFPAAQVLTWIEDLRAAGARRLSLSGGEPTVDPALESYIRHARALQFETIVVQTNAVQCAKPGYAERLRAAGLDEAFVSLHSGDAAVSDSITRAPGTFARTIAGIARLLDAGVTVDLNCVMTEESLATLAALPDFIRDTFGAHPKLRGLVLSVPTSPFDLSLLPAIVPNPTRLREALPRAIDRALALGFNLHGLTGPCGPPLCAYGADPRVTSLAPVPAHVNFRHYLPACTACVVKQACFGLRPEQIAAYGDACAAPIQS